MKRRYRIFQLLGVAFLSLNADSPKIEGLYVKSSEYLEIHGDGSVIRRWASGRQDTGTYQVLNDTLFSIWTNLKWLYHDGRYLIVGDTLADTKGNKFIKWSGSVKGGEYLKSPSIVAIAHREMITSHLTEFGFHAYLYKIRPTVMKGGGGSYVGYEPSPRYLSNAAASFKVISISADTISISGLSNQDAGTITIRFGNLGQALDTILTDPSRR